MLCDKQCTTTVDLGTKKSPHFRMPSKSKYNKFRMNDLITDFLLDVGGLLYVGLVSVDNVPFVSLSV